MVWLNAHRAELAGVLAVDGLTVHDHVPERLVPPAAMILFGNPFLLPGEVFGDYTVRHDVELVPMTATNDVATDDVEALVEATVVRLLAAGFTVEQVAQPNMLQVNNANYLSVTLTVTGTVRPI